MEGHEDTNPASPGGRAKNPTREESWIYFIGQYIYVTFIGAQIKQGEKVNDSGLVSSLFLKMCENERVMLSQQVPAGIQENAGMYIKGYI